MSRTNEGKQKLEADLEAIKNKLHDELIMRVRPGTGLLCQGATVRVSRLSLPLSSPKITNY